MRRQDDLRYANLPYNRAFGHGPASRSLVPVSGDGLREKAAINLTSVFER